MNPQLLAAIGRRATQFAVLLLLVATLRLHLLAALISAVAVYSLYVQLVGALSRRMSRRAATAVALGMTLAAFALIAFAVMHALQAFWTAGGLPRLLDFLADTLDRLHGELPSWLSSRLPASMDDLQHVAAAWLRANAHDVQRWGEDVLRVATHLLIGLIIGLLAAFERGPRLTAPWMLEVADCWRALSLAFTEFASAQLRIAAANTLFTAAFLLVALPLAGVKLPVSWSLVILTFVTGLVPIVGNLVSNGAILLVAVTVSPAVALAALVFLLAVHKLEYFLNAHFVGARTSVPAPVLLAAMLGLEAAFGVGGLIAAPIYCAWVFLQFGGVPRPRTQGAA
jgi:predicted PurR-regulated permease PerM